ncbi:MAG: SdrD B-like domain-containing protein, partial [Tepidisphaeraceae bacterium]
MQDAGEPGIPGVTLTLSGTDGAGNPVSATTTTDANGAYSFTEAPGTYTVSVTTPAGYTPTATGKGTTATDSNPTPSGTTPVALPGGGSDTTVDFGFYQPVSIGDFVWTDTDANGIQDSGEAGINGVTVTLTGTTGAGAAVNLTTTTAGNGAYLFSNLAPGTYSVSINNAQAALSSYTPTTVNAPGSTPANDSNPNPTTGITLTSGQSDLTNDFGYYQPVTIGDYVWNDANANGIQDGTETGINGVTLTLSGTNGLGQSVTDHATTTGNGAYLFTEAPGSYTVTVDASNFASGGALAGYNPSATLVGGDRTIDSNLNPSGTTPAALPGGSSDLTVDFGYYQPVSIGDYVWNDANANGIQNTGEAGISGVTLTLTGTNGSGGSVADHATTNASGAYLFTEAPGTYTVSIDSSNFTSGGALAGYNASPTLQGSDRTVDSNPQNSATNPSALPGGSSDLTIDFGYYKNVTIGNFVWNDLNANGIQNTGEAGISGVTLTLTGTNGSGGSVTDHATTNGSGLYLFTEAPGTYTVTVDASNFASGGALAGYNASPTLQGSDRTVDSNPQNSATNPSALPGGSSDLTIDFGYYKNVTIGDFVWSDTNANGVQDSGEAGINGVTLTLTGTNGAGVAVTDHATTSGNGGYLFTEAPGTYTVTVDASNFTGTGALAGFNASPTGKGTTATDSNANPSGTTPGTLAGGTSDLTIDFGYYKNVTIGDFVWSDTNANGVQDSGEPGIAGVTLTITGTTGAGVAVSQTTTTDTNGLYQFTEAPGTYTVAVTTPAGYTPTATGKGTAATDSNPSPSGTTPVALPGGGSDQTI